MTRGDLLKQIADAGYNVGFGAKKHFATYDLTAKVPGFIGFISSAVGVFGLVFEWLTAKGLSATLIVLGILGITMSLYDKRKDDYADAGRGLTDLFNKLKVLYYQTKSAPESTFGDLEKQLADIQSQFSGMCLSDQMLFSGWYAHYKFFWEHQIDWIDEQKHFRLFRDKIPLSLLLLVILALVALVILLYLHKCGT